MKEGHSVSSTFIEKITKEMPSSDLGPEAQLDYLLPLFRKIQSSVTSGQAKLAFIEPIIVEAIQKASQQDLSDQKYVTDTKRTMGMLVYHPNTLGSGKNASYVAMRIRSRIAKFTGKPYVEVDHYVRTRRTVTYSVHWEGIRSLGEELYETVRDITGIKSKPTLLVGPVTKRVKLGQSRKRR
jgi:hypothetical protein